MPIVFFRRRADRVETKGTLDTLLFEPEADAVQHGLARDPEIAARHLRGVAGSVGRMSRAWWRVVDSGKELSDIGLDRPRDASRAENA